MSTLYLVALGSFSLVMLGLLLDAMIGVSRKPVWHTYAFAAADTAPATTPPVAQDAPAGQRAAPVEVPAMAAVEARHSNFAGLTNGDEFQLTA